MNSLKISLLFLLSFVVYNKTIAQYNYDAEAIKYSMYEYKGSARVAGVAGAFSTVGPDPGAITLNPALVGMYRGSEVSGTLNFANAHSVSNYVGTRTAENRFKVTADQLSIVFATKPGKLGKKSSVLSGFGFSLNVNRVADFNRQIYFQATNRTNSMVDQYLYFLNLPQYIKLPVDYSNFPPDYVLAVQSGLVSYDTNFLYYRSPAGRGQTNYQTGYMKTSGGITDMSASFGANLFEKVFVGASLGLPYLNYKREYVYTESDKNDSIPGFNKFEYTEDYQSQGIGFNAKFGIIYKPIQLLKFGVSFSTPTYFGLKEQYKYTMTYTSDSTVNSVESPQGGFQFSYRQPYRVNAGASVLFDKYGFFSVDYEMVDYRKNKYNFGNDYREQTYYYNDTLIGNKYRISHQIRTGVELAYKTGRVRFGYAYQFSPFQKGVAVEGADMSKHLISAGLGYHAKRIYVDIAYVHTITSEYYAPYISIQSFPDYEDGALTKTTKDNILLTFGFKF